MSNGKSVNANWRSKFGRFVKSYGVERLATRLAVHSTAIYHWIEGRTVPKPSNMAVIRLLAREAGVSLTFDNVYRRSLKKRALREQPIVPRNDAATL